MAKELPPYSCGHCAAGRHRLTAFDPLHCRGIYGGVACRCGCNSATDDLANGNASGHRHGMMSV